MERSGCCAPAKSDPPDLDKLRPVSLTSLIAKVCESFVAAWVLHDIVGNISPVQFGCLRGRSTTHCLVSLANQLYKTADVRGTCSTWVLTDYSKAFDLVEHTMATKHLLDLGVRPGILPWIANFHSGRSQRTRYHGVLSESKQLTCGLAQGTKLGPIVFIAHTNSSTDNIQSPTWAFVDDLNLIDLKDSFLISPVYKMISTNYIINGHLLEVVKTAKCLGVTFQSDLRWDPHVAERRKIERIQRLATKIILGHNLPYDQSCKTLNLQTLHDRRETLCYKFGKTLSKSDTYKQWLPQQRGKVSGRVVR
ncbi:hypothetical protein Bbelb_145390 [Branchiostoma belcheri]|nr:hypothetical protein Bbelb_145390 [Branchiostoma belcheri]